MRRGFAAAHSRSEVVLDDLKQLGLELVSELFAHVFDLELKELGALHTCQFLLSKLACLLDHVQRDSIGLSGYIFLNGR